jgi:MFS family permease
MLTPAPTAAEGSSPPATARSHLGTNFALGVLDGSFFGMAVGLASYVTVLPLFVHSLTGSAVLIGSISAIRVGGWQLPQVLTVRRVSRLTRYKPMVLAVTTLERLPFLGLALAALAVPRLSRATVLSVVMALLVVHGVAGGFTATAWQAMIAKIMPHEWRGRFFGVQNAGSSVLGSVGALASGFLLARLATPGNFSLCFLLASVSLAVSWLFLSRIVRTDANFRWFVMTRALSQLPLIAVAFLTVYCVERFGIGSSAAGLLTAVLTVGQAGGALIAGSVGDRFGHRWAMAFGVAAATVAAALVTVAPTTAWLPATFALAGAGNAALWTSPLAMSLGFGDDSRRPAYIALSNTLVAPATFAAPLLGGFLVDVFSYRAAFSLAVAGGLLTLAVLFLLLQEPQGRPAQAVELA